MRAIKPFAEIMDIDTGVDVLRKIEWVGRTCYKSTDKITEGSAEKFVSNLIKHGHEAMLEHASFCFEIEDFYGMWLKDLVSDLEFMGYKSYLRFTEEDRIVVSANVRAWRDFFRCCVTVRGWVPNMFNLFIIQNKILFPELLDYTSPIYDTKVLKQLKVEDLKTETEFLTHGDVTVRFVVDRGISHELVRHRPASFAQESTRYCNYGKDKFGSEITFIIPEFFSYNSPEWKLWKDQMQSAENTYMKMIDLGVTPEKARSILPNSLKTEVIMTANCAEWKHFFGLRACNVTGKAHPQMLEISRPLLDDFKKTISVVFDGLTYGE